MCCYTIVRGYCRYYYRYYIVTTVVTISDRYKSVVMKVGITVAPNIVDSGSYCWHNSRCDHIQSCTIVAATVTYNHALFSYYRIATLFSKFHQLFLKRSRHFPRNSTKIFPKTSPNFSQNAKKFL